MNRYYSDSDDAYLASREYSDNIRGSGWQTPLPTLDEPPITSLSSSAVTRIIVESPFGLKKCDYTIDKSQRGRLIVTARRRRTFSPSNNKNDIAVQTYTIPYDADVDRLQSHVEQHRNRLIIEIPRAHSSYFDTKKTYVRSPDFIKSSSSKGVSRLVGQNYNRKNFDDSRKLEYRIDCQGLAADELDVFIQDRDLIVEGRNKRPTSTDPTQQHTSKHFSQKITLPNTVDLSKVISYFENGELRVEAPLKRGVYYSNEDILSPEQTSTAMVSRRTGGYTRVQSPILGNRRRHYRKRERIGRHYQPSSAMQRVRSAESLYHPLYGSRYFDYDDDDDDNDNSHGYRRRVNYEHYSTNRHDSEQQPQYKSIYEPAHRNGYTTRTTTYRTYPTESEIYYRY